MTSFQLRRELLGKRRPLAKGWAVPIDHIHRSYQNKRNADYELLEAVHAGREQQGRHT
jgi:hypothetical protein